MNQIERDAILVDVWNKSLHGYGTSYAYELRYVKYRKLIRILTFSGLVVPVALGAIYAGYSTDKIVLGWALSICAFITVVQAVYSLLSLTNSWSDSFASSSESKSANFDLFREFEDLAKRPPTADNDLVTKYSILTAIERAREQQDSKNPLSEAEQRRGMRWALRYFRRACVTCNVVPTSMKPSNCDTCGNF
jgi:mobilome CxxCx(11)CxxC protein